MKRIPRPKHSSLQKTNKDKKKVIIESYILNHFKDCNQNLNVNQLSVKYNIPIKDILKEVGEYNESMSGLMGNAKDYSVQLQALGQMIIFEGLETHQIAKTQTNQLIQSQGQTYKPFITAEVTRAIQTQINSVKNLTDILKAIMPSGTQNQTNILVQGTQDSGTEKFGPTEALKLLEQSGLNTTRTDKALQESLYQEYLLDEAPEVSMRYQDNNQDIGADLNKIAQAQLPTHEDRRVHEYGIIVEEDGI